MKLSKISIKQKLYEFLNDYFIKESGLIVNDNTSFLDEGIIDSTGVIELIAYIENSFDVRVEDDEIIPDNLDSFNQLVEFVSRKLGNK